jgi:hypothetical protein
MDCVRQGAARLVAQRAACSGSAPIWAPVPPVGADGKLPGSLALRAPLPGSGLRRSRGVVSIRRCRR